jgi:hypothetical protein
MGEKAFYDIHMHAFNLSHPSLFAFVRRSFKDLAGRLFGRWKIPSLLLVIVLAPLVSVLGIVLLLVAMVPSLRRWAQALSEALFRRVKRPLQAAANLLAVLENDIGSTFLLMEDCLREEENRLLQADGLHVGGETYRRVVMTPLMMDFGYKGKRPLGGGRIRRFHYDMRAGKPIVEQVIDVFGAIKRYVGTESTENLETAYPALEPGTKRVFEIYPFLGLNPVNYTPKKLAQLLEKYFADHTGRREDLLANMGHFDGNIDHLSSHAFAGIKVYPPLGFDPWPEGDGEGMEKVNRLYGTCCEKGIPLTTHGGRGGFVVVPRHRLDTLTAVSKWATVLESYPTLRLNLAHFPTGTLERKRQQEIIALVLGYENVYVDISCCGTSDAYYRNLRALFDRMSIMDLDKLTGRILFGSDFAVNLMWIESYNRYIDIFSRTEALTPAEKLAICSANPERFLFPGDAGRADAV